MENERAFLPPHGGGTDVPSSPSPAAVVVGMDWSRASLLRARANVDELLRRKASASASASEGSPSSDIPNPGRSAPDAALARIELRCGDFFEGLVVLGDECERYDESDKSRRGRRLRIRAYQRRTRRTGRRKQCRRSSGRRRPTGAGGSVLRPRL
mmetsp:Transcript_38229/g.114407  ORF Transcript_38229/g.114407 Transcript_38229/m.114407 type:complete len:155 (+) Transcript_38229:503-967(+)